MQHLREELAILNAVFDQQLQFLENMRSVWNYPKQSRDQITQQRIRQSQRQINRMKQDLASLDQLAEKVSILVNKYT